tara:strand:- start:14915 stop:15250 length:336 start_codon:yes stop_codon:yes gene_type:complete
MKKIFIISIISLMMAGCSSSMKRGTVAMKMSNDRAHVCLGDSSVKSGDRVAFYKNNCKRFGSSREGVDVICSLKKLGEGTVSKILNSHYSEVETDGSFKFKEGTLVQKVTK